MIVHHSHRIEDLVVSLAETVAVPIGPADDAPLRKEIISVQGRGMERWLSMELSRRIGVWANPSFPFPRSLIEEAFDGLLGPLPEGGRSFEPETLIWTVAHLLPPLLGRRGFEPIAGFLRDDASGDRLLQLSAQIAELFDRYVIYRPELVRAWEGGAEEDDWQASLWRAVVAHHGRGHIAHRARDFILACERGDIAPGTLPARASLFGVTTLPPLYVDVLRAMSRHVDLHLFALQCSLAPAADAASPLWRSLGQVGRDFHEVLTTRGTRMHDVRCDISEPEPERLLGALRRSVLRGEDQGFVEVDDSISVHACYSPMREVEVLHDQLAALFEADPTLEPRDVIVMTPDIGRYAAYVEAVFSAPPGERDRSERPRIPYRVADQSLRVSHDVFDAFSQLLDVLSGRLTASAVVDLLMVAPVRARFGIETEELDRLLGWIRDAGIRWGVDSAHRSEAGQPEMSQNTWRLGLDRLLLGVAMTPGAPGREAPFHDVLPVADVGPADADLLGRFDAFCEALFAHRRDLAPDSELKALAPDSELKALDSEVKALDSEVKALDSELKALDPQLKALAPEPRVLRKVSEWAERLQVLLADLIDDADEAAGQHAALRAGLDALVERSGEADFAAPIPLTALRRLLEAQLERGGASHGFLAGGVTFCELVPMRSIPFRVTALLGMNDGEFPRSRDPLGFDRIAGSPRPGDRNRREDDRYLFLEALVSTREKLVVTYVGCSVRDGEEQSPSVVVDELIDEIARLRGEDGAQLRERMVTRHPLHPFSPRYFDAEEPELFSFSGSDGRAARALTRGQVSPGGDRPFVAVPLSGEVSPDRSVTVAQLARFFEHPVRAFLQRRLGLYLREEVEALRDREPIELDALEKWQVGDRLLHALAAGVPGADALLHLRASGELPPGTPGEVISLERLAQADALVAEVRALRGEESRPPLAIDVSLDGWKVTGEIGDLWSGGRVDFQMSKLPHRRELNFWIRHLLLCVSAGADVATRSFLVGPNQSKGISVIELAQVASPSVALSDLLQLYERGLEAPLPLFPEASRKQAERRFAEAEKAGDPLRRWDPAPHESARKAWQDGQFPDREDPYLLQAFRDVDPLDPQASLPGDEAFGLIAERVYGPYLRTRRLQQ